MLYFPFSESTPTSIPLLFASAVAIPQWVILLGILFLVFGFLSLTTCYGLWVLVEWGRKLAIAICAISIPMNIISLKMPNINLTSGMIVLVIVSIAVDVIIIVYLSKEAVKSLFSQAQV